MVSRKPSKKLACPAQYQPEGSGAAELLRLVGRGMFETLQRHFGGTRVWIPKPGARPECSTCRLRDRCIVTWRGQRQPVAAIARHLGISSKSVYRVCERPSRPRWAKVHRER